MFDEDLIFHDGTTITGDITPTSKTRSSGSAVLDIRETGSRGMAAVMIVQNDLAETSDTLQVTIQESDTEGSGYEDVAAFPLLTQGTGMPGTYMRRFVSQKRFVRALIDITDNDSGGDFTVASVFVMLTPHFFERTG